MNYGRQLNVVKTALLAHKGELVKYEYDKTKMKTVKGICWKVRSVRRLLGVDLQSRRHIEEKVVMSLMLGPLSM